MKNLSAQTENRLSRIYSEHPLTFQLEQSLREGNRVRLKGLCCSSPALLAATVVERQKDRNHVFVLPDHERAAYFHNDLAHVLERDVYYFPSTYKRITAQLQPQEGNIILRTGLLEALLAKQNRGLIVVTHAQALAEKVVSGENLHRNTLPLKKGETISIDFLREMLQEYRFTLTDFVYEPGQYAIRGSIVDIFSYSHHLPYRIDFFGDEVESIRSFDPETQLSDMQTDRIHIIPDMSREPHSGNTCLLRLFDAATIVWSDCLGLILNEIRLLNIAPPAKVLAGDEYIDFRPEETFIREEELTEMLSRFCQVEFGHEAYNQSSVELSFDTSPQPSFHKNFELLAQDIASYAERGYTVSLMSDNNKQFDRMRHIFSGITPRADFVAVHQIIHGGFIDHTLRRCLYTDHQIFERYHKYRMQRTFTRAASLSFKELSGLHPGDYMVHTDHGIGIFGGLEKMEVNGKAQECIRLVYRNNDVLYVHIHNLHKISKFRGKEGEQPKLNKLGTPAWQNLKQATKRKVKDIARDLIALYAKRMVHKGFAFSPDTYMQEELEASFIYEDTPDQLKATQAVKAGMEHSVPMDYLVCGDVGFGKTEVAIRAAFKAVADNKQVAVLVPTTILALQHEQTFRERLAKFPCRIDSISRLKSTKAQHDAIKDTADGKVDVLIGTHRLLSKDIQFKDLGLLIIDEEQKFGVAAKEKLKALRTNVDTLTLTATPIPRTLQFSLMGVREMSVMATPPPNRHPIQTEVSVFDPDVIREAIEFEVSRGGQVFFIHNRVQTLHEMELLIRNICPGVSAVSAHGQMEGRELEKIMLDFISGDYNVLVATSIIESGLDIPNANTIIIHNAHMFGLSDLHQLRGRVGRSNKRAFCYLLSPPLADLTPEARRRLKAIEDFSDLGSGFSIAMQDLDIRGAGNLMGAEQSGFIAEIGFETYHRILNEAIAELKEEGEFQNVFKDQDAQKPVKEQQKNIYISDCQIDTDLELLFPESYMENVSERIRLYRDLDNMDSEEKLYLFEQQLIDRFGPIPQPGKELIDVVRLRWLATRLGFEKMTLRNERLLVYFVSDQKSPYYQSDTFKGILQYVMQHPQLFRMKEARDKLAMTVSPVKTVNQCMDLLGKIEKSLP